MSPTQWALSVGCILGTGFVLQVLIRRDLRKKFPIFFNCMIAYGVMGCIGLGAYLANCAVSYYLSFVMGSVFMFLQFGVIYEVLANTLKPYSALVDLAKMLFCWAAVFLLLTALVTALATNGQQATRLEAAMTVVQHSIRLMQCGLLLFLMVFENRLGISWRNHGMAIAMGLGVYSASDLITTYLPSLPQYLFDLIDSIVYIGILAFWGCFLLMREQSPKSVLDSPSRLIFQRWNEALMATPLVSRKNQVAFAPVESFLPGVEQTVERVMARKMMH